MARKIRSQENNFIGPQVKKLRKEKKMSQQDLSDKLRLMKIYVCRGSVSRIEQGLRTVTDMELWGIAKVLDVSMDSFFPKD
ncbi:MAG: helix-turn-helix transcriptional regulator [Ruminococcus sp.]|nr:helix-turn-helix transcriptional regulator [Ruminococcus sp.]